MGFPKRLSIENCWLISFDVTYDLYWLSVLLGLLIATKEYLEPPLPHAISDLAACASSHRVVNVVATVIAWTRNWLAVRVSHSTWNKDASSQRVTADHSKAKNAAGEQ